MKVLVTGGDGFIGRHLCSELTGHGHNVLSVDYARNGPGSIDDLRVPGNFQRHLDAYQPDTVVHLAAKVGRLFGEDDPQETIADNAGMTALVAQACGARGVRLVYASTSEVYGDQGDTVCVEDGTLALPHNVYGLSKRWGEEAARLYAPDGLTALRFSMPYGPGLPAGRGRAAIINMLHQALHGQPIPVHRRAERSWCWIGDTVRAARIVIEQQPDGGAFNIGRDDNPTAMLLVALIACHLTGADPRALIKLVDAPPRQTVVKRLATMKIRALGWQPEVELEDGMARTLEWVRTLDSNGDPP